MTNNQRDKHIFALNQLSLAVETALSFPPVRKIRTRIHGPTKVRFPTGQSIKGRYFPTELESDFESYLPLILKFKSTVLTFKFQPFHIRWQDGIHTPDVLILYRDRCAVIGEIKPSAQLERPSVQHRVEIMQGACREQGLEYKTFNEDELSKGHRHYNLTALYPYSLGSSEHLQSLISILENVPNRLGLTLEAAQRIDPAIDATAVAVGLRLGLIESSHTRKWGPYFDMWLR